VQVGFLALLLGANRDFNEVGQRPDGLGVPVLPVVVPSISSEPVTPHHVAVEQLSDRHLGES